MGKHAEKHSGDYGSTDYGAGAPPNEPVSSDTQFEPIGGRWGADQIDIRY